MDGPYLRDSVVEYYDPVTGECVIRRALEAEDPVGMPAHTVFLRSLLKRHVTEARRQHEFGGVAVAGIGEFDTDRESQGLLAAAVVYSSLAPEDVPWKLRDGSFVTLQPAQLALVAKAVGDHVRHCFANEARLEALLAAAMTEEELLAIDVHDGY